MAHAFARLTGSGNKRGLINCVRRVRELMAFERGTLDSSLELMRVDVSRFCTTEKGDQGRRLHLGPEGRTARDLQPPYHLCSAGDPLPAPERNTVQRNE